MARSLVLTDDEIQVLINGYTNQISDLDTQISELTLKRNELTLRVKELGNDIIPSSQKTSVISIGQQNFFNKVSEDANNYVNSLPIAKRVDNIFSVLGVEASTREVYEAMVKEEPSLKNKEKTTIEAISTSISRGIKAGFYTIGASFDGKGKKRFKKISK